MDLRLIAFDLDGTLLRSDKSISPRTIQALHAAQERGVLFIGANVDVYEGMVVGCSSRRRGGCTGRFLKRFSTSSFRAISFWSTARRSMTVWKVGRCCARS